MANALHDPKNLAGVSNLIDIDDDTINISSIEKDIINGAEIMQEEKMDVADAFNKEMAKITSSFQDINMSEPSPKINAATGVPIGEENISSSTGFSFPMEPVTQSIPTVPETTHSWMPSNPTDPQLNSMTAEQTKQSHISHVMQNIETVEMGEIDKEREEDDKANLLEQIATLRSTLDDDGIDISRIEQVDHSSSSDQIKLIYKALRLKNDSNRYRSFAEELILAGAHGLEYLFDGQKEWFGKKPDLVGWPDTVKVKLRRMRYETTTFVKEIMQEYNISPGVRIALELIPSMFLYTRTRKIQQNDNIVTDEQFKGAIGKLNGL